MNQCRQSQREKGLRDNWSKIHVTLSTMKSEFKQTFTEEVKTLHFTHSRSQNIIPHDFNDNL